MADADPQVESNKPGAFISERHRNPAELMALKPRGTHVWAAVCAILATVIFVVLLALLWVDWSALQAA